MGTTQSPGALGRPSTYLPNGLICGCGCHTQPASFRKAEQQWLCGELPPCSASPVEKAGLHLSLVLTGRAWPRSGMEKWESQLPAECGSPVPRAQLHRQSDAKQMRVCVPALESPPCGNRGPRVNRNKKYKGSCVSDDKCPIAWWHPGTPQ